MWEVRTWGKLMSPIPSGWGHNQNKKLVNVTELKEWLFEIK